MTFSQWSELNPHQHLTHCVKCYYPCPKLQKIGPHEENSSSKGQFVRYGLKFLSFAKLRWTYATFMCPRVCGCSSKLFSCELSHNVDAAWTPKSCSLRAFFCDMHAQRKRYNDYAKHDFGIRFLSSTQHLLSSTIVSHNISSGAHVPLFFLLS